MAQQLRLPELEAEWKWPRQVSPYLVELEKESLDWACSFGAFEPKAQRMIHDKGKLSLLAGMCYPRLTKEQVRSGCDLMHLFFMFDEDSDISRPAEVWAQAHILVDALRNSTEPRPSGEWVGGDFARQFWSRIPPSATDSFRRRFLATWKDYVYAVARQAEHRDVSRILDVESYFLIRRDTSGAPSTICLYEMDLNIPDSIRKHPVMRELETLAIDLIVIANDLLSYKKELKAGDLQHNIVTCIMKQFDTDLHDAISMAGKMSKSKMLKFYDLYLTLPRFIGPVDLEIQRLVDGMAQCVSGVMHWSYESWRYFGDKGLDVKRTRLVDLD